MTHGELAFGDGTEVVGDEVVGAVVPPAPFVSPIGGKICGALLCCGLVVEGNPGGVVEGDEA